MHIIFLEFIHNYFFEIFQKKKWKRKKENGAVE